MSNKLLFLPIFIIACTQKSITTIPAWTAYDESSEIAANADNESQKLRYQLIQSRVKDKNSIWVNVGNQIANFSEVDYQNLKPLILEQNIPTLQAHISTGELTYEKLAQWYLYRIVKFENNRNSYLNAIIDINPDAVDEARERDKLKSTSDHPIYGMPILIKDNINVDGMATTAGAHVLLNNNAQNAFIIDRIQAQGGIILGKTNLSEWANFLCLGCPNGYSAVGGQTLNPYGRKIFDTGGSSSGSGSGTAANYAAASIGTETSGSILSPSSANSIVGLKPTVGLLSRGGIVPISSTLDTPGPMTRNVTDNAILLSAMSGEDSKDVATKDNPKGKLYWQKLTDAKLNGLRFGVNKNFLEDSIYVQTIGKIVEMGGIAVEYEPLKVDFDGFGDLLTADMKIDLPHYLNTYASNVIPVETAADVVVYNLEDSLLKIPYGQGRFIRVPEIDLTAEEINQLKVRLKRQGVLYFQIPMVEYKLDAILSINNWSAGYAAAAHYPCLTVPMGYRRTGQPVGLTFIGRPFEEDKLLKMGYAFEQGTQSRKLPDGYN